MKRSDLLLKLKSWTKTSGKVFWQGIDSALVELVQTAPKSSLWNPHVLSMSLVDFSNVHCSIILSIIIQNHFGVSPQKSTTGGEFHCTFTCRSCSGSSNLAVPMLRQSRIEAFAYPPKGRESGFFKRWFETVETNYLKKDKFSFKKWKP